MLNKQARQMTLKSQMKNKKVNRDYAKLGSEMGHEETKKQLDEMS